MDFVAVGLGGMIGSLCRHGFNLLIKFLDLTSFPWSTLVVNSLGCLLAGMGLGLVTEKNLSPTFYLLLVTGFCGGFTTFSAFGIETLNLLRQGAATAAILNVSGNLILGLALSFLGFQLIK